MESGAHFCVGERGALEVLLEKGFVALGRSIHEGGMSALDLGVHLVGCRGVRGSATVVESVRTVIYQIDVAAEPLRCSDRDRNRDRLARERLTERIHRRLVRGVL